MKSLIKTRYLIFVVMFAVALVAVCIMLVGGAYADVNDDKFDKPIEITLPRMPKAGESFNQYWAENKSKMLLNQDEIKLYDDTIKGFHGYDKDHITMDQDELLSSGNYGFQIAFLLKNSGEFKGNGVGKYNNTCKCNNDDVGAWLSDEVERPGGGGEGWDSTNKRWGRSTEGYDPIPSTVLWTNVKFTIANPVLDSLQIVQNPAKMDYFVGEQFDATGMKVDAVYDDGSTKDVTADVVVEPEPFDTPGTKNVNVSYTEGETNVTVTTSFTVNVKEKPSPEPQPGPDNPGNTDTTAAQSSSKTADSTPLALVIAIVSISAAGLAFGFKKFN